MNGMKELSVLSIISAEFDIIDALIYFFGAFACVRVHVWARTRAPVIHQCFK